MLCSLFNELFRHEIFLIHYKIPGNTLSDIVNMISVHTAHAQCKDLHTLHAKMHVRVSARATVCTLTDAPRMTNTCEAPVPSYRNPSLSSDSASNFSRSAILVTCLLPEYRKWSLVFTHPWRGRVFFPDFIKFLFIFPVHCRTCFLTGRWWKMRTACTCNK